MASHRGEAGVIGLMVGCMLATPLLQVSLAVVAPQITEDLNLSRTEFGLITTALFAVAALSSSFGRSWLERFSAEGGVRAVFALTAVACVVVAAAPHGLAVAAAMALAGFPMALANPATNQMLYERVSVARRGLVAGMKQSGVKVAQVLAGAVVAPVAVWWGWRTAFILIAGVLAVCCFVRLGGETVSAAPNPARDVEQFDRSTTVSLRALALFALCMGVTQAAVGAYLPLFSHERLGLSVSAAGIVLAIFGAVGVVSRIVSGLKLEAVIHVRLTFVAIAGGAGLGALGFLLSGLIGNVPLFVVAVIVLAVSAPVWSVYSIFAMVRWTSGRGIDRATNTVYTGFFTGFMVGPPVFGFIADRVGYEWAWLMVVASSVVAMTACLRMSAPPDSRIG